MKIRSGVLVALLTLGALGGCENEWPEEEHPETTMEDEALDGGTELADETNLDELATDPDEAVGSEADGAETDPEADPVD